MSLADQIATDASEVFLNTDDWAVDAAYTPVGGSAQNVVVLLNEVFVKVSAGEVEYEGKRLSVQGLTSVFEDAPRDSTLVINSVTYYVQTVGHDLNGLVLVELSKAVQHG